jgi:hypothetical protein
MRKEKAIEMKRLQLLGLTLPLAGIVLLLTFVLAVGAAGGSDNAKIRWDIVSIDFATGSVNPGGEASARAEDDSRITLTGSGTFRSNPGSSQSVTGGGTWSTSGPAGTGSGTFTVTGFVDFDVAPGVFPLTTDNIGAKEDIRAGLAVLQIAYSDGSDGILVISCHLSGTPDSVFEGITASKGFVDYWNHEKAVAGVDANRTAFHVVK